MNRFKAETIRTINTLSLDNVTHVFAGRVDHDGIAYSSGRHRYNAKFAARIGKQFKRRIPADEVSDSAVLRVIELLKRNARRAEDGGHYIDLVMDGRLFTAFLRGNRQPPHVGRNS